MIFPSTTLPRCSTTSNQLTLRRLSAALETATAYDFNLSACNFYASIDIGTDINANADAVFNTNKYTLTDANRHTHIRNLVIS